MRHVSLARRNLENIRKDIEAFDSMVDAGISPPARERSVRRRRRGARSTASFAGLATTALLATLVLLTNPAL